MLKYIFKNYDQFLESIRYNIDTFLHKKSSKDADSFNLKPSDILDIEIKKHEQNLKDKESTSHKDNIRKKILYLTVKKKALNSTNLYIKRAENILEDGISDTVYEALDYLNRIPSSLDATNTVEIQIFKALLYEMLEDFDEAANKYKSAIKIDKSPESLTYYKKFVERSRELLNWNKHNKNRPSHRSFNLHNIANIEDMPAVAKKLENIAKYYARSPKSRELGKRYFKEVIKMYKKLKDHNPKEYSCLYVNSLIDAVEFFMLPSSFLKEAQFFLLDSSDCTDMRVYLMDRIKELKEKNFIKKSKVFE